MNPWEEYAQAKTATATAEPGPWDDYAPKQPAAPVEQPKVGELGQAISPLQSMVVNAFPNHPILRSPLQLGAAGIDALTSPFRALDAGVNEASKPLNEILSHVPGLGGLKGTDYNQGLDALKNTIPGDNILSNNVKAGVDMLGHPSTYAGGGMLPGILNKVIPLGSDLSKISDYGKTIPGEIVKSNANKLKVSEPVLKTAIPDIEKEAEPTEKSLPQMLTAKDVKAAAGETNQAPKSGILSTIDPSERNMLAEPITTKDKPFTDYAIQAQKAKLNAREMTPMDMAGIKAKQAFDELETIKNQAGKAKNDILSANEQTTIPTGDIQKQWQDLVKNRLGLNFDEDNAIVGTGRKPSELSQVNQINDLINNAASKYSDPVLYAREADDLKSAINDISYSAKANQVRPVNTVTEGIGKQIANSIDGKLDEALGPEYQQANQDYSRLLNISNSLNKRLGEVVDPATGQTRMGASLMKSAVMSNSDRGSKALFSAVKDLTGHDLIKDASYAKIAMDAVGDTRATDLLKTMAETRDLIKPSLWGTLSTLGNKGIDLARGDKLTQLINYYNKIHAGSATPNLNATLKTVTPDMLQSGTADLTAHPPAATLGGLTLAQKLAQGKRNQK
jgi:hypothetical protein